MAALPVYTMQTVFLPMSLCHELDKLMRDFLWGDSSDHHLVNWTQVCQPKFLGGLSIKSTHLMNLALLAKLGWQLLHEPLDLWARVLHCKYLLKCSIMEAIDAKYHRCSSTWRDVLAGVSVLNQALIWRIGHRARTRFWSDSWLDIGPLNQHALMPF